MEVSAAALNAVFSAVADGTRRAILARLMAGEASVSELAEPFNISLPAISKHLRVLEEAGLLVREKEGRVSRCRLVAAPMRDAAEWITGYRRHWEERLDALDAYLQQSDSKEENSRWKQRHRVIAQHSTSPARSLRRGKKSSARGPTRKP